MDLLPTDYETSPHYIKLGEDLMTFSIKTDTVFCKKQNKKN